MSTSKQTGLKNILLGHHLDDDIETFIMQSFKGSTTSRRIPLKQVSKIVFFHPLLEISKMKF